MSYCINPNCCQRQNDESVLECVVCGNPLTFYKEGRYSLIKPLGNIDRTHAYEVFEAKNLHNNTSIIIKVLKSEETEWIKRFEQEKSILSDFKNLGLPRLEKQFNLTLKNGHVLRCLVMEKVNGDNLEEWLQKNKKKNNKFQITEREAISWLKQMAEIIDKLHQRSFFHRDIKPANIMVKRISNQVVLIDFGDARMVTGTVVDPNKDVTSVYSHGYTAPEQMKRRAVPQSDFFSLGRTFTHLLTGIHPDQLPTSPRNDDKLIWRDKAPQIKSKELANLIDYLMEPNFKKRPKNTQEILQRINEIQYRSIPKSVLIGVAFTIGLLIGILIGGGGVYLHLKFNNDRSLIEQNN
ncbi:protein kinase [Oscillatoriales cyanobacterium USR001]|nr:protein kinase [Oscillatoriales cyanobacterium USR001]